MHYRGLCSTCKSNKVWSKGLREYIFSFPVDFHIAEFCSPHIYDVQGIPLVDPLRIDLPASLWTTLWLQRNRGSSGILDVYNVVVLAWKQTLDSFGNLVLSLMFSQWQLRFPSKTTRGTCPSAFPSNRNVTIVNVHAVSIVRCPERCLARLHLGFERPHELLDAMVGAASSRTDPSHPIKLRFSPFKAPVQIPP